MKETIQRRESSSHCRVTIWRQRSVYNDRDDAATLSPTSVSLVRGSQRERQLHPWRSDILKLNRDVVTRVVTWSCELKLSTYSCCRWTNFDKDGRPSKPKKACDWQGSKLALDQTFGQSLFGFDWHWGDGSLCFQTPNWNSVCSTLELAHWHSSNYTWLEV